MSEIIDHDVRSYPTMPMGTAIVLTVLVKRSDNLYKAYSAIVPDDSRIDPNFVASRKWVMSHGQSLRYEECKRLFTNPNIKPQEYAR